MFIEVKIIRLLVFFVASLLLLLLAFPSIGSALTGDLESNYQISENSKIIDAPVQGAFFETDSIRSFNPGFEVYYSLNGGDTFLNAGKTLNFEKTSNHKIIYKNTAIRWRHPKGEFSEIWSLVLKLRNEQTKIETKNEVLTYFNKNTTSLPIVSLSVKESDLFDELKGIMVYGERSWNDEEFYKDWWYRSANFRERGIYWERKVNFQYFEEGIQKVDQDCGLRISGNATRYFPQKSMRVYAREMYGEDKIDFPFWGEDGNKKATSILLRNSGNDNTGSLFADLLIHNICRGSEVLVQSGKPVSVYINGNYWGLYNLRERIDEYFVSKRENVKYDEVTLLDGARGELKAGLENVQQDYIDFIDELKKDESEFTDINDVKEFVSIKSFMDYIIFETFFANGDWPNNNVVWYKAKDKKWKWLINDLDYTMAYAGSENVETNTFEKINNFKNSHTTVLFNFLIRNEEFKERFKNRVNDLYDENLSVEHMQKQMNLLKSTIQPEVKNTMNRWRMFNSEENWKQACDRNMKFLINRRSIYLKQVENL